MSPGQEQGLGGAQLAAWCDADDPNIQACIHLFHFCIFVSKYIKKIQARIKNDKE